MSCSLDRYCTQVLPTKQPAPQPWLRVHFGSMEFGNNDKTYRGMFLHHINPIKQIADIIIQVADIISLLNFFKAEYQQI